MNTPGDENQVLRPGDVSGFPAPAEGIADILNSEAIEHGERRRRHVATGVVFGASVGLLMGAVVGAACCWLTSQFNYFEQAVLIGALAGPSAGALIGLKERKARGELVRPDIATFVCVAFGLSPALLMGVQGLGFVRGRFSGLLLVGAVFAGPMFGLLIGGILDRSFEEYQKKSWGLALAFGLAGVGVCAGSLYLLDAMAYAPDPKEVSRRARSILSGQWQKDPSMRGAAVQNVTLVRDGRTRYAGFVDATFAGRPVRLYLAVVVEEGMLEMTWTNEPEDAH